jgi:hypothetical protein
VVKNILSLNFKIVIVLNHLYPKYEENVIDFMDEIIWYDFHWQNKKCGRHLSTHYDYFDWARSAIDKALGLVPKRVGFKPDLFPTYIEYLFCRFEIKIAFVDLK